LIRRCDDREVATILEVITDAAGAYRKVAVGVVKP